MVLTAEDLGGRNLCALYEDAGGHLWGGTAGGRLIYLAGNRFMKWDLNLGKGPAPILGLLSDKEGNLWIGVGGAIYRVSDGEVNGMTSGQEPFSGQCFFQSEVAPGTVPAYGWPRSARSSDDRLWFALDNGTVVLDLSNGMLSRPAPPVVVENVVVNGSSQPLISPESLAAAAASKYAIRMPANLFSLELKFTGLNFSEGERTRFRHKLDGFDSDWVDGGTERVVRYGRLPPGMYTFRVQSGSANGMWYPNDAYFNFFIPARWWESSWAIVWYCLAGAILVAGIARLLSTRFLRRRLASLAAQQAMQRERIRIAQDMHDEIGSKLTKISFMSERAITELNGQEAVARKLDSIATTSRDLLQSLDEIVWAVNPHNDTLENLAAYLGHYATEYLQNTAVECELRMPRGLPDEPVSAETRHNLFLAFEESLNNALKHGKASHISVSMQTVPGAFEIEIKDNGCGFAFNPVAFEIVVAAEAMLRRRGNGLVNMRQRLLDVGGQCEIESQPGKGTKVCLRVPVRHGKKN
jgi:signal transduction histidine kinase